MAERTVRLWPDAVLSQTCAAVDPISSAALIDDLFDTMYAEKGRGLAAPQIGTLARVFVVDVTWKDGTPNPRAFINPEILAASENSVTMDEQCLSIPNLPMPVRRPEHIQLRWNTRDCQTQTAAFDGILARCIQHELDHLNGRMILDHQSPEDRAALETAYAS